MIQLDEYEQIQKDFPNVSFDHTSSKNNPNFSLVMLESGIVRPDNYTSVNGYKKRYTWNRRIKEHFEKHNLSCELINGVPLFNNNYWLDQFTPIEEKEGICCICRNRNFSGIEGDIAWQRESTMKKIDYPIKHCYGKIPYGDDMYRGVIGNTSFETKPSSKTKLEYLSRYRYNLCFENTYHPLWSWDYLTEKLLDCFKSKTVAIYYGCWNIEDLVPIDLFIDFRPFMNNITKLSQYLKEFTNEQYEQMTEKAFEWVKNTRLGNIEDLRTILRSA